MLKENLYGLSADVVGLQEVVFGPKQLDQLSKAEDESFPLIETTHEQYQVREAALQIQYFDISESLDPRARIDGNATLVSEDMLIHDHRVLHISAVRNAQLVKIALPNDRMLFFVNTHLHHEICDDLIRKHQSDQVMRWAEMQPDYRADCDIIMIAGDFNANPDSETYKHIIQGGYVSAYREFHGEEPEITFPTGLTAEWMDTDPPGTFDFIFIKGKCQVVGAEVSGRGARKIDPTIFGSDHMAVVVEI